MKLAKIGRPDLQIELYSDIIGMDFTYSMPVIFCKKGLA